MNLKTLRISILAIIYLLFIINYNLIISPIFGYQGFSNDSIELFDLFCHSLVIITVLFFQYFMSNSFYLLIYNIYLIMVLFGQSVYSLNTDTGFLFYMLLLPIFLLFFLDKIDKNDFKFSRKQFDLNNKYFYFFSIILSIFLVTPFLSNFGSINLSNLLFLEIYDTRVENNLEYGAIIDYLYSAVARVYFPFLLLFFIIKKRYALSTLIFIFILLLFLLNGAVKSILIGALMSLYFMFFDYKNKNIFFILTILIIFIVGIFSFIIWDSIIVSDYLRRIFYLPAYLFEIYYNFFDSNFTNYKHTNLLGVLGAENQYGRIPSYIGENVLGNEDMVANVGIFVEGYISSGFIGVVISSVIFTVIIFILKAIDIDRRYFGLIFVYIYILNTSFLETLLVTHGLIFLIIFSYLFIPTNKNLGRNGNGFS